MSAIADFQKKYGLTPDGEIGKKTLLKIKEVLGVKSDECLAHFMGQCAHESGSFVNLTENLNYSAQGLTKTFSKYFNNITAKSYERKPNMIANKVYANRMGNGNEQSGDGWLHRGFGFIQLTGKNSQNAFADYIGDVQVKETPSLIATKYPFESAKYFFDVNNIWNYCNTVDANSILKVSKIINLGSVTAKGTPIGLDKRTEMTLFYYNLLKK